MNTLCTPKSSSLFSGMMALWLFLLCTVTAHAQNAIFIDSRLLVLAHPLARQYDSKSHRFRGTPSEPLLGGFETMARLKEEVEIIEAELKNFSKHMRETLGKTSPKERSKVESELLRRKKESEAFVGNSKLRLYNANLVPGQPGVTSHDTILPQTREVQRDMKNVIQSLQKKYKASLVIDISNLFPISANRSNARSSLLLKNHHFGFWHGNTDHSEAIEWLREAGDYWHEQDDGESVIPFGALDVRLESIELMEQLTRRSK